MAAVNCLSEIKSSLERPPQRPIAAFPVPMCNALLLNALVHLIAHVKSL